MIYLPTRLVQAFPKLLLAIACLAMSAFCTVRLAATTEQLTVQWTNYPPTESLLTLAVTVAILAVGALVTAWWSLGFALTYLAMITVPTSGLHRALTAGALRVAPRIARTALVTVTGASLTLTATGALAAPTQPTVSQAGSLQAVSAQTMSPQAPLSASPTGPKDVTGTTGESSPAIYLGFGTPGTITESDAGVNGTGNSTANAGQPPLTTPPQAPPKTETDSAPAQSMPTAPTPVGTTYPQPPPVAPHPTGIPSQPDSLDDAVSTDKAATSVTVTAGDSLWSITASLAASADGAEIAALWPQLYSANSAAIGGDPDFILPGMVLAVPTNFGLN